MNCGRPNADPSRALTAQFGMTPEEAELIVRIIQEKDPSLESLKHPKVQEMILERKGRWSREEEDYANFLCKEFYLGVSQIESGMTRRAYLSSKLTCTKMRISKKFKGKNTGKDMFRRKTIRPDGHPFSPAELEIYKQRHVELEKRFIKTALKSVISSGVRSVNKGRNQQPKPKTSVSLPMAASVTTMPVGNAPAPSSYQLAQTQPVMGQPLLQTSFAPSASAQPSLGLSNLITTSPANTLGLQPNATFNAMQAYPYNQAQVATTSTATSLSLSQLNAIAHLKVQHTNALQAQSYENKLNPLIAAMSMQTPSISPNPVNTIQAPRMGMPAIQSNTVVIQQRNVGALTSPNRHYAAGNVGPAITLGSQNKAVGAPMATVGSPHQANVATFATWHDILPPSSASRAVSRGSSKQPSEGSVSPQNEVPDLLVGFEKHAAALQMNVTAAMNSASENQVIPESSHFFAGAGGVGESPYITSKSFDDLHRFLGKDLPHLDLNQSAGPAAGANRSQLPGFSQFGRL